MLTNYRAGVFAVIVAALFLGLTLTGSAGTGLKNGLRGKKTIVLNNKVGANVAKFVSTAPLEEIKGSANDMSGTFTLDLDNLEASRGNILVEVKSMQTGIAMRDKHRLSTDWLDAKLFPTLTFNLDALENVQVIRSDNAMAEIKANVTGTFSMHGESKAITALVVIKYVKESAATKQRADGDLVMVTGVFQVALKDFKVKGTGGVVGKKVGEVIEVELALFGSTALVGQ